MSFSISVAGKKAETLRQLGELVHQHDSHSKQTADLITSLVEGAPAELTIADEVYDTVFSISAYGHSSAGHDLPSFGVSFTAGQQLRETPASNEVSEEEAGQVDG